MTRKTEQEIIDEIKQVFDVDARFYDLPQLDESFELGTEAVIIPRTVMTCEDDELPEGVIYVTGDPDFPWDVAALLEDLFGRRVLDAGEGVHDQGMRFYIFAFAQVQI